MSTEKVISVILRIQKLTTVILALSTIYAAASPTIAADDPPPVAREFRAAWVATVQNIDWPSRPGLPSDRQQRELVAIFDKAVELNLNAIILQIRPSADALYPSQLEPWSEYLSGTMGQPPEPFYDPLEFAVDEAHRRGLQLHVWFNPYRVRAPGARSPAIGRSCEPGPARHRAQIWRVLCGSTRASRRRPIISSPC